MLAVSRDQYIDRLLTGLAGTGCITSQCSAENIHDDRLWRVSRFRLNDLGHDKIALGDHPLEVDRLFRPMGNSHLFQKLPDRGATVRHRRV
ncbi:MULTISPECIES: hypothetical protein [unclassified Mesorhizobium]|uniref:hypothetical protein n=1 Tax=unclassified Mesorhizobium TaxID=325217 RepID=UPI00333C6951